MTPCDQGNGKRRDPQQRPFESGRDGSRIGDVIPKIFSLVDARDDQSGTFGENGIDSQMDAISRGSINSIDIFLYFLHSKGPMKGERVSNGTLFCFGGYNANIPNLTKFLCQEDEAFRMDSVIIGD
jgi:hypothetical protein